MRASSVIAIAVTIVQMVCVHKIYAHPLFFDVVDDAVDDITGTAGYETGAGAGAGAGGYGGYSQGSGAGAATVNAALGAVGAALASAVSGEGTIQKSALPGTGAALKNTN